MRGALQKSQKFMLYAYLLLFVAQFFSFGNESYYYTTTGGGFTLLNEAKVGYNGWHYHPWYIFLPLFGLVLYAFYTRIPKITWWWVALAFCVIAGFGGLLGFVSMIVAGYAVYQRRKEQKLPSATAAEQKAE